jgi:hypothetical protein
MKREWKDAVRHGLPALALTTLVGVAVAACGAQSSRLEVDEITVRKIRVIDSEGRERVTISGEFPPRRSELAGLLFHNEEGTEAGGLVYYGRRDKDGKVEAGGLLTFDQYGDDQIMRLQYEQLGHEKTNGVVFAERPDKMSERVLAFYQAFEAASSDEERERLRREVLPTIPQEEFGARRLFVGRNVEGASLVSLHDPSGRPRLILEVDEKGAPSITFLDASGEAVRRIQP